MPRNLSEEYAIQSDYVVKTEDLVKYYQKDSLIVKALDGINLRIKLGEHVSVVGPSGSGKTTLLNMIGGVDRPTFGKVYVDGVDLTALDDSELAWFRCRKVGYIFQTFNLIPNYTALENVVLPMIFAGVPRNEQLKRAEEALERVALGTRATHKPSELSAGEQQRVAIARALVNNPVIILADEPTGNLDPQTGLEVINLLRQLNKENEVTIITATRDLKLIDISDRFAHLRDGHIERFETRDDVRVEITEQSMF